MARVAWSLRIHPCGQHRRDRELRFLGGVDSTPTAVEHPVRKLGKRCRRLSFAYVSHMHASRSG